jgi:RNA polymerase sigma-70 factor (ECF subfamily)
MPQAPREEEFTALLAPVLDAAFGLALHLSRNRDDAEDIVQDAAVSAYRAYHTFQPGTNFRAWFLRIVTNSFRQRYRKAQRSPQMTDLEDAPDLYLYRHTAAAGLHAQSDDPATLVMDRLTTEQVSAAVAALPEEYRVVAALYFFEELSYEEIAAALECPLGTVRSRLHRGRKLLQKSLWQAAEEQGLPGPPARATG